MRGMVGQGYTAAFAPRFPGKAISKYLDYREQFYFKVLRPLGLESVSKLFLRKYDSTTCHIQNEREVVRRPLGRYL
jgi:hypothetical protein